MDVAGALRQAVEPGVITRSTLVSLAIDQGPRNEAGRLFLDDGIELDEIKEIRIEFLNILNIDYLWLLKNLVKLTLSHNIIERIENLLELTHLRELDLSFNRIKIMENLNTMHQLEVLLLYNNEISIVQGIDNLKKLIILNIGKNKIADWKHVTYLRDFKALRSLNTCENPCAEMEGYTDYLFAFVPQLLYYQYKMISESTRQSAVDKHHRVINNLEENESKERAELALQQEYKDRLALLSESYVEYLDEDVLFQQMFSLDKDRILSTINKDTQDAFEEYKKSFSTICREIYELGLQEHSRRTEEIELFDIAIRKGKEDALNEVRRIVDDVLEKKSKIFVNIKNITEALIEKTETDTVATDDVAAKTKQLFDEFNDLLSNARTQLISKEIILHDQLKNVNEVFKINMTDIVNSFLETARGYFSLLRNAETKYNNIIKELVSQFLNDFEDETHIPAYLLDLFGNKDAMITALTTSHNVHVQMINDRENRLIDRLNNWLKEYTDQLIANENTRNRQQILEISHFCGFQQQEFNSLGLSQQLYQTDDVDLDDVADMTL